jgi:hypothetical protein
MRRIHPFLILAALLVPAGLPAQQPASALPADQQIASAVLPIPEDMRASATVMGYGAEGALVTIRPGTGIMTCLASAPASPRFHVACYHKSLEAFMARGRELRGQGMSEEQADTLRLGEVQRGRLPLPHGSMVYSITGERYDPAAGTIVGGRRLYVVYLPGATEASTGIPTKPAVGAPWIMFPGTPKAHIMLIPPP